MEARGGETGLDDRSLAAVRAFAASRPDIVALILFGSTARGQARAGSDVDVAVLLTQDAFLAGPNLSRLTLELMDALDRDDVDVVVLNDADYVLQFRVVRDGVLLHTNDNHELGEYTVRALQQYYDTELLRRLQRQQVLRRITEHKASGVLTP